MTPLAKKLQIKPGKNWLIYNAPDGYLDMLDPLPAKSSISTDPNGSFDGIQLFAKNKAELLLALNVIGPLLKSDTIFWITYPKRNSGIASDMKQRSWDELAPYKLQGVASMSVTEKWAGSRFRPIGQAKVTGMANHQIPNNAYAAYIDVVNKVITLPTDMAQALEQNADAQTFYQQLSYSNRKEYMFWILTAKLTKTRAERLVKMIEKLNAGKKNPAEK